MTRKDFNLIANVLADCHASSRNRVDQSNVDHVIEEMADALAKAHPRFDRERFVTACRGY